ncbi:MAG: hypothetical protein JJU15_17510 [Pararhodobacter sp.]|nr:hypothetical protein [Pararhodobacter sp.]
MVQQSVNANLDRDESLRASSDRWLALTVPAVVRDSPFYLAAQKMAMVYSSVATFENAARKFIQDRLLEELGENWWQQGVPSKTRAAAEKKKKDEENHRYHGSRGGSLIYYTMLSDLSLIIEQNFDLFSHYIPSIEWSRQIFKSIERSRNIIMHSGDLSMDDVQRVAMNIRDWFQQIGG